MKTHEPAYLHLLERGILKDRATLAADRLVSCTLCPRRCGVSRTGKKRGFCRTGSKAVVSSFHAHFGEESPLVGHRGSGTIFFTHCNLRCNFCQNVEISHGGEGQEVTADQLAWIMLEIQRQGCHNINLVTPSHVIPAFLAALALAAHQGLTLPIVYNTGGYDSVETLRLLDGVVDIYMPDFKFWDPAVAQATCTANDYPEVARTALVEMHRQVGDLQIDERGLAFRGLLVRHLVMPRDMAGTRDIMAFLARSISTGTYVNIMPQYHPCGEARLIDGLNRRITPEEYRTAIDAALVLGIHRLDSRRRVIVTD